MAVYRLRGELILEYILQGLFFYSLEGKTLREATAASLSGENAIPTT